MFLMRNKVAQKKILRKKTLLFYLIKTILFGNDRKETTERDMKKMNIEIEKKGFRSSKQAIDVNNINLKKYW